MTVTHNQTVAQKLQVSANRLKALVDSHAPSVMIETERLILTRTLALFLGDPSALTALIVAEADMHAEEREHLEKTGYYATEHRP